MTDGAHQSQAVVPSDDASKELEARAAFQALHPAVRSAVTSLLRARVGTRYEVRLPAAVLERLELVIKALFSGKLTFVKSEGKLFLERTRAAAAGSGSGVPFLDDIGAVLSAIEAADGTGRRFVSVCRVSMALYQRHREAITRAFSARGWRTRSQVKHEDGTVLVAGEPPQERTIELSETEVSDSSIDVALGS